MEDEKLAELYDNLKRGGPRNRSGLGFDSNQKSRSLGERDERKVEHKGADSGAAAVKNRLKVLSAQKKLMGKGNSSKEMSSTVERRDNIGDKKREGRIGEKVIERDVAHRSEKDSEIWSRSRRDGNSSVTEAGEKRSRDSIGHREVLRERARKRLRTIQGKDALLAPSAREVSWSDLADDEDGDVGTRYMQQHKWSASQEYEDLERDSHHDDAIFGTAASTPDGKSTALKYHSSTLRNNEDGGELSSSLRKKPESAWEARLRLLREKKAKERHATQ